MTTDHNSPETATAPAFDTRGGNHFIIDGVRIHEDDLTPAQRALTGLPPRPVPDASGDAAAESPDAAPAAPTTDPVIIDG